MSLGARVLSARTRAKALGRPSYPGRSKLKSFVGQNVGPRPTPTVKLNNFNSLRDFLAERESANLEEILLDLQLVSAIQHQCSRSATPAAAADWSENGRTITTKWLRRKEVLPDPLQTASRRRVHVEQCLE